MKEFEPKIIGFFCNWCTYAGADLAGTSRLQYPPNVRPIRLMCSGSVDPVFVLKAFLAGVDGVLVGGCHPGECHYATGNYFARRRMIMISNLLDVFGLERERFRWEWISAAEGKKFAETVREFTETIRRLGPSPLKRESRSAQEEKVGLDG